MAFVAASAGGNAHGAHLSETQVHVLVDLLEHEFEVIAQRQFEKPFVHAHAVGTVGRGAVQDEAQLHAASDVTPGMHQQAVAREFIRHAVKLDLRAHLIRRRAALGRQQQRLVAAHQGPLEFRVAPRPNQREGVFLQHAPQTVRLADGFSSIVVTYVPV